MGSLLRWFNRVALGSSPGSGFKVLRWSGSGNQVRGSGGFMLVSLGELGTRLSGTQEETHLFKEQDTGTRKLN